MEDLEKSIKNLHKAVERLNRRFDSWWKFLVYGILQGAGAMVGAVAVVVMVGWILNIVGVIPFFKEFAENLRELLNSARS